MRETCHHAVITGGSGSLGGAIATALCSPTWKITTPSHEELDVANESAVRRYFDQQPVDLLVCAAGITRDAPLVRLKEQAWDETWAVNFRGAAHCANAVIPGMMAQGEGHIVLISSFSAIQPPIGQVAYAAAKSALLGLVQDLASRYGRHNIRVNAILPGFLETSMTETVSERRRSEILADHRLGRFNQCRNAAEFVAFLHHQMPHTSGQAFQLDSRLTGF